MCLAPQPLCQSSRHSATFRLERTLDNMGCNESTPVRVPQQPHRPSMHQQPKYHQQASYETTNNSTGGGAGSGYTHASMNARVTAGPARTVQRISSTDSVPHQVDWSQFEDVLPLLGPIQKTHYLDINELTIVRPLPCNYMKADMGNWNGESVLIKSIDTTSSSAEVATSKKALVSEIMAMARIAHPNIVEFKGFSISEEKGIVCVSEYMEGKTLRTLLDDKRKFDRLTWANEKINFAIDICSALAYMHNLKPRLIHRNIKASKVLLSKGRKQAKLSGFGSSRDRSFEQEMTNKIGEIEWSAPELIMDDEDYTEKVDVYSFGVLMTELDTGLMPFADVKSTMASAAFTNKLISGALRPQVSPDCPPMIAKIVKACLQSDAQIRPSSDQVLRMLHAAKAELNLTILV
ncbi:Aste57867_19708 [Aphanomyces stellatus]|uniref:Aste57867_19708 protein n=1 Tax=Aphanomyces stellatus TaxID=120398 RepID=A0A485LD76_9STRA|nr:hypothetical protein As57867_019643 [Aphanomyces stellatus]VFT96407.1 Aste57867_19708 [Aphanomyces stellatus]